MISFLNNDTKELEVSFLKQKSKVLQAFRNYLARNERGDCQNYCLCTDEGKNMIQISGLYFEKKGVLHWSQ